MIIWAAGIITTGLWFVGLAIFSIARELERANNRMEGKK